MAYNIIGKCASNFDWTTFHEDVQHLRTRALEIFPIEDQEESGSDVKSIFVGISIPFYKVDEEEGFWDNFVEAITVLTEKFEIDLFDLYQGTYLRKSNLEKVKEGLS